MGGWEGGQFFLVVVGGEANFQLVGGNSFRCWQSLIRVFLILWHFQIIWYFLASFKTIILCCVHSIWFVKYVFLELSNWTALSVSLNNFAGHDDFDRHAQAYNNAAVNELMLLQLLLHQVNYFHPLRIIL